MRLRRVVFFEDRSKHGSLVHFHGHALVSVPRSYTDRFDKYSAIIWTKIFPSLRKSEVFERHVFDQDRLVPYVSKFSTSEYDFIADLI